MMRRLTVLCIGFIALAAPTAYAQLTTAFTYQGNLTSSGSPAQGVFDFRFQLFDAPTAGVQSSTVLCSDDVAVSAGLFTVTLDFGAQFQGSRRFLEIQVRAGAGLACANSTGFVALSPRQELSATPNADFALAAGGISRLDSTGATRILLTLDGSDNLQLLAPPDHTLAFRTGTGGFTDVRATLTPTGRLGINTTTPDALLHVQSGDVGVTGVITSANLILERTSDNWLSFMSPANRLGGLAFGRPGSTATELFHGAILYNDVALPDAMQFRTGGNLTRMTLTGAGDLGIGTTTPTARLHVVSAAGGNGSVILPNNAISAPEILDEPGCAGSVLFSSGTPITTVFPTPPASILSQTITAPTNGFILVYATLGSRATSTGAALCRFGLATNTASIPADAMHLVEFQPAGGGGSWSTPVTLQRIFPVSAGAVTAHVMAQSISGIWEFDNSQVSVIFVPTAYGPTP
jgi:hypothetical protein